MTAVFGLWSTEISKLSIKPPKQLEESLVFITGFTHRIEGSEFYIDNKVIRIPKADENLYFGYARRIEPNKAHIEGSFRFVENTSGTNAFGANVIGRVV